MIEYFVLSQGFVDGPFDKKNAIEFLWELCGDKVFTPPERYKSTVVFSRNHETMKEDVVKYYDELLNGEYVYWNNNKLNQIMNDLENVK